MILAVAAENEGIHIYDVGCAVLCCAGLGWAGLCWAEAAMNDDEVWRNEVRLVVRMPRVRWLR